MDLDPSTDVRVKTWYDEPAACNYRPMGIKYPVCPICKHLTTDWDIRRVHCGGEDLGFHVRCYEVNKLISIMTIVIAVLSVVIIALFSYIAYM